MMHAALLSVSHPDKYVESLFAFASSAYADAGPGAIVVQEGNLIDRDTGGVDSRVTYLPLADPFLDGAPDIHQMVLDYDPSSELVLVIRSADGETTALTLNQHDNR